MQNLPFNDASNPSATVRRCLNRGAQLGELDFDDGSASEILIASQLRDDSAEFITLKSYGFDRHFGPYQGEPYVADRNKQKQTSTFLKNYRAYQSNRVTSLTEAIRGYLRHITSVDDLRIDQPLRLLIFRAIIRENASKLRLSNPNADTIAIRTHGSVSRIFVGMEIPRILFRASLTPNLLGNLADPTRAIQSILENGEDFLCAAARYGAIDSIADTDAMVRWANQLLRFEEEAEARLREQAVEEVIKIVFGVIVNFAFVLFYEGIQSFEESADNSDSDCIALDIIHSMNVTRGEETFYSRIGQPCDLSHESCAPIWQYLSSPFQHTTEPTADNLSGAKSIMTKGMGLKDCDLPSDSVIRDRFKDERDPSFFSAVNAALHLANAYRAVAVHEGKEQELKIVVGKESDLKPIFKSFVSIREYSANACDPGDAASDIYVDEVVPNPETATPTDYVSIRSILKSCCGVLSYDNLCMLIDPTSTINGANGLAFRWSQVLHFSPPVFRFPKAKKISDVIRDPGVAMIRVVGRSRMEFIYRGKCYASWTNADARWRFDDTWQESDLVHVVYSLLRADDDENDTQLRGILNTVVDIVCSVSADDDEGGAVLLVADPDFDLSLGPHGDDKTGYGKSYSCLHEHIAPMTEYPYNGLVYLNDIKRKDNFDVVRRLITMDGGVVINVHTRALWARRRFSGPRSFGNRYTVLQDDSDAPLASRWRNDREDCTLNEILTGRNLHWENCERFKEWGTRHQSALAVTGLCLECSSHECEPACASDDRPRPRFLVLTVSADGGITLMRNGTVITPKRGKEIVLGQKAEGST
jgi:hypothetical protein